VNRSPKVFRRNARAVLAVAATLMLAGSPEALGAAPLDNRLDRALGVQGVSPRTTGAVVVDLADGSLIYRRRANLALRPASVQKLMVAAAALAELGPGFRIETEVLGDGRQKGSVWNGDLILKGYGDPTLTMLDLDDLAHQVRKAGIRRVRGSIFGDESFFDDRRMAPGWLPSFYIVESPPLSALVVDRAKIAGETAAQPALEAARLYRSALERAGVRVDGEAGSGVASTTAIPLAWVLSKKVSLLVRSMNRESDNFVAEMLLKGLGARLGAEGTTTAGLAVVRRTLAQLGVPLVGTRLADGSGLSLRDRLSARTVAALLVAAWHDPELGVPFTQSLAVAGINGTLEDRLERAPARGLVRAKTGTTAAASSLAGYIGDRYVFVVLMNSDAIPWVGARRGQDRFVQLLAGQ
jgi:D-alanyl-D-alanine carboxypeptidase/D-alanyl-D-alanine-endopeptidase (penicillin-binding protein 4)